MRSVAASGAHHPRGLVAEPRQRQRKDGLIFDCLAEIHLITLNVSRVASSTHLQRRSGEGQALVEVLRQALSSEIVIDVGGQLAPGLYCQTVALKVSSLSLGVQHTASTVLSSTAGLWAPSLMDKRMEKSFCPLLTELPECFSYSSMVICEQ